MRPVGVGDGCPAFGEHFERVVQVGGIPQRNRRNHQVQGHGVDVLIQPRAVANRTFSIETDRPFERVVRFAFVQADVDSPSELGVLQPLQREQSALNPADFAQRRGQGAVARIPRQLANEHGGTRRAGPQRCHQTQMLTVM